MKMSNKQLRKIRGLLREQRLEEERRFGRPRASTFGGKPSVRKDRRNSKRALTRLEME